MKRKDLRLVLVTFAFVTIMVTTVSAAETGSAEPQWLDTFHNPAPWLEMGADIRWRYIYGWNLDTLDNSASKDSKWQFTRNRFRWWTKSKLSEDVDFNTRLVWEFRTWDAPLRKQSHTDFDELIFDHFNLTLRNLFDMPLTAVIGRQDIILGKAWLVLDGTPLDGSRTIFIDAARFTYDWKDKDTKIDMIYIDMAAASDRWLKPFNDRDKSLTEQDEHGAILYVTNNSLKDTQLEGYVMYKNDNPVDYTPSIFPSSWSKKAEIFTYGGAVSGDIDENWKYRCEGALQTGDKDGEDLRAFGTKSELAYHFNDELKSNLHLTYEYLSGDDPGTSKDEAFDPLWGEWPQWSELYIYSYSMEGAIAETTNLHRVGVGHTFNPNDKVQIKTDYNLLWADQNSMIGDSKFSNSGNFRGQLFTCWLKYNLSKSLKGHLLAEYFLPGDYYDETCRDHAVFLRANVEYTF